MKIFLVIYLSKEIMEAKVFLKLYIGYATKSNMEKFLARCLSREILDRGNQTWKCFLAICLSKEIFDAKVLEQCPQENP